MSEYDYGAPSFPERILDKDEKVLFRKQGSPYPLYGAGFAALLSIFFWTLGCYVFSQPGLTIDIENIRIEGNWAHGTWRIALMIFQIIMLYLAHHLIHEYSDRTEVPSGTSVRGVRRGVFQGFWMKTVLFFAIIWGAIRSYDNVEGYEWYAPGYGFIGIMLFIFALAILGMGYLAWQNAVYAITDKRVLVQKGVFGRSYGECEIGKVQNIVVFMDALARALGGFGTLNFVSAGTVVISFPCVPDPDAAYREVREIIGEYEQRKKEEHVEVIAKGTSAGFVDAMQKINTGKGAKGTAVGRGARKNEKFCPECGAKNATTAKFCAECGGRFK